MLARTGRKWWAAALLAVPVLAVSPASMSSLGRSHEDPAERALAASRRSLPPLPEGSRERTRQGLESSAVALAAALRAVPVRDGSFVDQSRYCPVDQLRVSWQEPGEQYRYGAFVTPVGFPEGSDVSSANGVVVCEGSTYAYLGFQGTWEANRWVVTAVPAAAEHEEVGLPEGPAVPGEDAGGPSMPSPSLAEGDSDGAIDPYPQYDPQRLCDPTPKPGTLALRNMLLATYPGTRTLGISRNCGVGSQSEHKEGRAFDWGVNASVTAERAAAEDFIARLLATDSHGNRHALARRLGVMYVIWDRQIWSSARPDEGSRPYRGPSAHIDHVHISLSWPGALARTSYWTGSPAALASVPADLGLVPMRAAGSGSTDPSTLVAAPAVPVASAAPVASVAPAAPPQPAPAPPTDQPQPTVTPPAAPPQPEPAPPTDQPQPTVAPPAAPPQPSPADPTDTTVPQAPPTTVPGGPAPAAPHQPSVPPSEGPANQPAPPPVPAQPAPAEETAPQPPVPPVGPPATDPVAIPIDPATGQPVGVDPATGEPPGVDPATGQPMGVDPATGQPVGVDPATGEPLGVDPATGQPMGVDPATGEPLGVDPATGQRMAVDPATGEPLGVDPATGEPVTGEAPPPVPDGLAPDGQVVVQGSRRSPRRRAPVSR